MDREGMDYWNKFEAEIGMRGAASRWKAGEKPTPESLLKIKNAFNISIDWLLTGEESTVALNKFRAEPDEAPPLSSLQANLLNEAIVVIEKLLKEEKILLLPEQKSDLLTRVYNDCAEDRVKPNSKMVERYLWFLRGKNKF